MNMIENKGSGRTRLVRTRGGSAGRLLTQHPDAFKLFGQRYSSAWLLDHVANGRMELWDFQHDAESIGLLAAYVSQQALVPSYFIWALYVRPAGYRWQRNLWAWVTQRARDLGCGHMEFVTPRDAEVVQRYLSKSGYDWEPAYTGFLVEV